MNTGAWITVLATAALLGAASRQWRTGEWIAKPLAATGFVLSALQHGALSTGYGRAILAALVGSWCGDVLLIPRTPRTFLAGLAAFLLGHLAYASAFALRGLAWVPLLAAAIALAAPLWMLSRWLLPKVPRAMLRPVRAYMLVITAMVALAVGTHAARPDAALLAGAVMFYLSDLSVARDRFVAPGFSNKLWGWPLYFGAQLLLASTVARASG